MSGASARFEPGRAAPLFAALGDETRLRLLARLAAGGPASITRLAEAAPVSRQAVRKHLTVLEGAGLVRGAASGREHVWALEAQALADAHAWLDLLAARWDDRLGRLKSLVERDPGDADHV